VLRRALPAERSAFTVHEVPEMINLRTVRQSMMKWNVFLSSCVFVAGLSLKVGAPLPALIVGFALAAALNWFARRQQPARFRETKD
jgi:hypothetical protein